MRDLILEYVREYAPYVVIAFNAIMSMLTYRRTGKIRKNTENVEKIAEELPPVDSMPLDSDEEERWLQELWEEVLKENESRKSSWR